MSLRKRTKRVIALSDDVVGEVESIWDFVYKETEVLRNVWNVELSAVAYSKEKRRSQAFM